jgi:HEAT repeat protein
LAGAQKPFEIAFETCATPLIELLLDNIEDAQAESTAALLIREINVSTVRLHFKVSSILDRSIANATRTALLLHNIFASVPDEIIDVCKLDHATNRRSMEDIWR